MPDVMPPLIRQNPINARKGITTQHPVFAHKLIVVNVRILLMPVRALRRTGISCPCLVSPPCQNPINARKGITTVRVGAERFFFFQSESY